MRSSQIIWQPKVVKDTDTIVVFYPNPVRVSFRYSWTVLIIITGSTINPGWQILRLSPLVSLDLIFNLDWESSVLSAVTAFALLRRSGLTDLTQVALVTI